MSQMYLATASFVVYCDEACCDSVTVDLWIVVWTDVFTGVFSGVFVGDGEALWMSVPPPEIITMAVQRESTSLLGFFFLLDELLFVRLFFFFMEAPLNANKFFLIIYINVPLGEKFFT